jgi:hypothetical protein
VFGTTRSAARASALKSAGVEPILVDVFDAQAVLQASVAVRPEVMIDQLTELHVDAAAQAAVLAMERGAPGIYNVAEPSPAVSVEKARRELGWTPEFRSNDITASR